MNLEELNKTELLELIRQQLGRRVDSNLTKANLIRIVEMGKLEKVSKLEESRYKLELFIDKNKQYYQTNLPCRGQINEGKCTQFKCSEILHLSCFSNIKDEKCN